MLMQLVMIKMVVSGIPLSLVNKDAGPLKELLNKEVNGSVVTN
jgi:hypothetical protein